MIWREVESLLLIGLSLVVAEQSINTHHICRTRWPVDASKRNSIALNVGGQANREALESAYEQDLQRLISLRTRPLEELLALSNEMESKWRRMDWNYYARIMIHVCSEISNRGLDDRRLRQETENFARMALSHSAMFLWEHQTDLVGALGYQRASVRDSDWLRERSEKARFWLETWHRLEQQTDPSFDVNDRRNRPALKVFPPPETGLPAGTPPSAIKDPRLRAQYEAAIAENRRKAKRAEQQFPLLLHGPAFKARAERALVQLYSQPPSGTVELKRYLAMYLANSAARQRVLQGVVSTK
jgi:hypothetical protein